MVKSGNLPWHRVADFSGQEAVGVVFYPSAQILGTPVVFFLPDRVFNQVF